MGFVLLQFSTGAIIGNGRISSKWVKSKLKSVQKLGHFCFESSQQNSRCILLGSNFIYILCTCINLACWGCFFFLILRWLLGRWQGQKNQENPFFKNTGVGFTGLSFAISLWWMIYWYISRHFWAGVTMTQVYTWFPYRLHNSQKHGQPCEYKY